MEGGLRVRECPSHDWCVEVLVCGDVIADWEGALSLDMVPRTTVEAEWGSTPCKKNVTTFDLGHTRELDVIGGFFMNLQGKRGAVIVDLGDWVVETGDVDDPAIGLEELLEKLSSPCDVVDWNVVHLNVHMAAKRDDSWEDGQGLRFKCNGLPGKCFHVVLVSGKSDKDNSSCVKVDAIG